MPSVVDGRAPSAMMAGSAVAVACKVRALPASHQGQAGVCVAWRAGGVRVVAEHRHEHNHHHTYLQ
jgi:hypothetical protein